MIKLLVFDVDGCLSDGSIIYGVGLDEYKAFNVKDGLAISSWNRVGFKSAIITGRESKIVQRRSRELGITYLFQGVEDKRAAVEEILEKEGLEWESVAAIGDDLNDISMLKKVGWSFTPFDGVDVVKKSVKTVLETRGGRGAVREMIDMIVEKEGLQGRFLKLWQ